LDFAVQKFSFTKQNVQLLSHKLKMPKAIELDLFAGTTPFAIHVTQNGTAKFYFMDVHYQLHVLDKGTFTSYKITFKQPVKVEITKELILLQSTIMEKKIAPFFPSMEILKEEKLTPEEILFEQMLNHSTLEAMDINKGVKQLWHDDLVDCPYITWKKSRSVSTERMDEEYTLKQQYPDLFKQIMSAPLNKTGFKFIKDVQHYLDFQTEPLLGRLSFNKYPSHINQIDNVVKKILSKN
jgi:hypothetical protein